MKIKKGEKKMFFSSLFVLIGLVGMIIYQLVNGEFNWGEILLDILMAIVMSSTTMKFVEFKK